MPCKDDQQGSWLNCMQGRVSPAVCIVSYRDSAGRAFTCFARLHEVMAMKQQRPVPRAVLHQSTGLQVLEGQESHKEGSINC